jgi:cytochrome c-type biogenesis protein CcmH
VTIFIVICAAMVAAALVLVVRPLFRSADRGLGTLVSVGLLLPLVAAALYWEVGHRTWESDEAAAKVQVQAQRDATAAVAELEQKLRESPDDVAATLNLGEALVAMDERSLAGRAGELFESALKRAPNNAKALWYGAMSALATGKLPLARERLQGVLKTNPPEQIRTIIERQVQAIEQQLGESQMAAAAPGRALNVQVTIAPTLAQGLDKSTPLFVLARDPEKGGAPLAVARHTAGDLPISITLTDNNAMVNGHGISSVPRVQVVARISKTGTPQAQPGDFFGEATVEFKDANPVAVKIAIDRKVEK